MSLGLSPGAGLFQASALLINNIEPVAHRSMDPNKIIEARSPLTKRCATAQICTEWSIGCLSKPLNLPLVCDTAKTAKAINIKRLLRCTKKAGGVQIVITGAERYPKIIRIIEASIANATIIRPGWPRVILILGIIRLNQCGRAHNITPNINVPISDSSRQSNFDTKGLLLIFAFVNGF